MLIRGLSNEDDKREQPNKSEKYNDSLIGLAIAAAAALLLIIMTKMNAKERERKVKVRLMKEESDRRAPLLCSPLLF